MNIYKLNSLNVTKQLLTQVFKSNNIYTSAFLRKTLYEILRVRPDASQNEIKDAYYRLSKVYHPDIAQDENSLKMFREITEAYDTLGSIKSRLQYDKDTGILEPVASTRVPSYGLSGYRDGHEMGVLAPDYKKFMSKKTHLEHWEDAEYLDRRLEVQMKKYGRYVEDPNYIHTPHMVRILKFAMALLVVKFVWTFVDRRILDVYCQW